MSSNVTTQDAASNLLSKFADVFSFSHQGVAGSTSLTFGVAGETQKATEASSTGVTASDAALEGGSGGSTGVTAPASSTASSSGGNALSTNDQASSFSQAIEKTLTFDHQGVAGSTQMSFGVGSLTQGDSKSSTTSAALDDGLFGLGSGTDGASGSPASSSGSSSGASGGGNVFTTNDSAVNFDSQMMKSFDFGHQGVAGSTSIGFGSESATQWSTASSSTAEMFDDLFGQSAWGSDGSHSLIG